MTPTRDLMEIFSKVFRKVWDNRASLEAEKTKSFEKHITKTEKQIEQLLDRILRQVAQRL